MNNHSDRINLRPREYAVWQLRRIAARRWGAALASLAIGSGLVIAAHADSHNATKLLEARIARAQLLTVDNSGAVLLESNSPKTAHVSHDERATTPSEWAALLSTLGALAHERVYFRVVEVSRDSSRRIVLFLQGVADATDKALAFAAAIETTELFEPLEAPTVTPNVSSGVQFELSAEIAPVSQPSEKSP